MMKKKENNMTKHCNDSHDEIKWESIEGLNFGGKGFGILVFGAWCQTRVWCLESGVWCLVFGVWCLVLGVLCLVLGVWGLVSGVCG